MLVCEECHEKDKNVTKCDVPLTGHRSWTGRYEISDCDICGKQDHNRPLYSCTAYRHKESNK